MSIRAAARDIIAEARIAMLAAGDHAGLCEVFRKAYPEMRDSAERHALLDAYNEATARWNFIEAGRRKKA